MSSPAEPLSHQVAVALGECVRAALAGTPAGVPTRVCVPVAGEIAWDACDCGQLAVTTPRLYPSRVFPAESVEDAEQDRCGTPYLGVPYTVSILRCAAGMDDDGNPPTCEQLAADALVWHQDAAAVRRGLGCCLQELEAQDRILGWVLGPTTAVGPQGGCVGSETVVTVALPNCLCPEGS